MGTDHSLDDKYTATSGDVFLTGTQALVRLPLAQMRRDRAVGLNTAAFVTGYRGSPLGAYDQQLQKAAKYLEPEGVTFRPGLNEDLAATAIWGTQQVPLSGGATKDGVVGIWYGKGPGVDRCGDVFKHANAAGSSAHGGVLCLAGDDHTAKSSTLPHQSDHAFMAAVMPVLYPSSIHEFVDLGLLGIAMSRYSGCWVGYKVISDTVETSAVVRIGDEGREFVLPTDFEMPAGGLNIRWPDPPLVQDDRLQEHKAYAALAFARANRIDETVIDSPDARFGIVATGKAFEDVRQALVELGIDEDAAHAIGLRVHKVRMPWPLEPEGIRRFSEGLEEVLIVEERREIIENQIKQQLFNWRADVRPRIVGKFDHEDRHVLPLSTALSISRVARAIAERVLLLDMDESLKRRIRERHEYLQRRHDERLAHVSPIERQPWFCSGCPHNTSTRVPEGSKAMAGIGCHYMVQWMDRDTETFTQMGGEGVPWAAIAHYTDEKHRFVNLGDGTYFHSGLLAVRASKAAGVNITYKVLYNDAVAMTGGQTHDGELSPQIVTRQLHAEGVAPVWLVTDTPDAYDPADLAPGTRLAHRDELDAIQLEARELTGTNAIVYVQTCAAEKRRRRKRGLMDTPDVRLHIDTAICEGCGDCSVQSNCISLEPVETAMGRKRRINQSSCNLDYSCLKGFCPSFVTVEGGRLRKPALPELDGLAPLPDPDVPTLVPGTSCNIAITGVGGTGVLTVGALLGMAAHVDGQASMILDMAGLAQKGGAVLSHVRLATEQSTITSPQICSGGADVLIAADSVVAASKEGRVLCDPERTTAIVNTTTTPVAAFVRRRDLDFRDDAVSRTIASAATDASRFLPFADAALKLAGDAIATNVMMLGYAWQSGLVPLSFGALDRAIELNGVAVGANRKAFSLGRRLAADAASLEGALGRAPDAAAHGVARDGSEGEGGALPGAAGAGAASGTWRPVGAGPKGVAAGVPSGDAPAAPGPTDHGADVPLSQLDTPALVRHRAAHLERYQDAALARRYTDLVDRVRDAAAAAGLDVGAREPLVRTAAVQYARLLSPKDEYEVARLFSDPAFRRRLDETFEGDYRISLNLAPPLLARKGVDGRPGKRGFGPWMLRILGVVARMKGLRGTALDPFGRTADRKGDRAWVRRFEEDVDAVLGTLTPANAGTAAAVLGASDAIRGYGPVRLAGMEAALAAREKAWMEHRREKPVEVVRRAA